MEGPWDEAVTSPMSFLVKFDSESTRQEASTTGGNSSRNCLNNICQPLNLLVPWIGLRENLIRKPWFPRQIYMVFLHNFPLDQSIGAIFGLYRVTILTQSAKPSQPTMWQL